MCVCVCGLGVGWGILVRNLVIVNVGILYSNFDLIHTILCMKFYLYLFNLLLFFSVCLFVCNRQG